MSCYSTSLITVVSHNRLLFGPESDDELITVTHFSWIKVTRNDFEPPFNEPEPKGLKHEFDMNMLTAVANSYGIIVVNVYYVLLWALGPTAFFTCIAHLYFYYTLLVPHTYASYIRY